ncbi:MAG: hypothetical protein LBV65_03645 [Desulfovibrio sp.]|jgi:hypothetical protein|nr:hypothetical protein [Desulfovibrio sp.]
MLHTAFAQTPSPSLSVYIAASFRHKHGVRLLARELAALGCTILDWTKVEEALEITRLLYAHAGTDWTGWPPNRTLASNACRTRLRQGLHLKQYLKSLTGQ